ncbi:MAG: hypothetical protein E4H14_10565 [Candidatus Thorarchaeota archaeon]|nr:MAG: hypothetical protein E4H14_10565 [Candidatus Thorarchaeota archaeon]
MYDDGYSTSSQRVKIRAYGVSASSVRTSVEEITGVCPGKKEAVLTIETGRVFAEPEIYSSGGGAYCDCSGCGGGSGDGEGLLVVIIVIAVLMIMIAVVWAFVMIAFSVLTVGGFLKRRYRTVVVIERQNRVFLGKLAVSIFRKNGVLEYPFGHEGYDNWIKRDFRLHLRLKRIRQVSLFFGIGWGWIEIIFKLNELLVGYITYYDLWILRFVMLAIFVPLLFYSPILEMQFLNAHKDGDEIVMRLLNEEYDFSPNHAMSFADPPKTATGISSDAIKKINY